MNPWVYVIMIIMFFVVSGSVYIMTKMLLTMLLTQIAKRKESSLCERIYKETMKEL